MKKITTALAMLLLPLFFSGCSKEEEPAEQTFFVNTYYTYSDYPDYGEHIASPTMVMLFEDNGNEIDTERISAFDPTLYDTAGNELQLRYTSPTTSGINIFENIPNGKYVILTIFYPYTFVNYYSCKKISVNYDYRATTEKIVFDRSKDSGYQEWQ